MCSGSGLEGPSEHVLTSAFFLASTHQAYSSSTHAPYKMSFLLLAGSNPHFTAFMTACRLFSLQLSVSQGREVGEKKPQKDAPRTSFSWIVTTDQWTRVQDLPRECEVQSLILRTHRRICAWWQVLLIPELQRQRLKDPCNPLASQPHLMEEFQANEKLCLIKPDEQHQENDI